MIIIRKPSPFQEDAVPDPLHDPPMLLQPTEVVLHDPDPDKVLPERVTCPDQEDPPPPAAKPPVSVTAPVIEPDLSPEKEPLRPPFESMVMEKLPLTPTEPPANTHVPDQLPENEP